MMVRDNIHDPASLTYKAAYCLSSNSNPTVAHFFAGLLNRRCLVMMVNDNIHDPASLAYKAVCCIFQVLETYGALPLNYICRIFAHNGIVQRLYAVIKQIISWQRQQQQRGASGYASSTASAGGGVNVNTGGGAGSLLGLKLHHMHSPSAGSVGQGFAQDSQSAGVGGEGAGSSGRRGAGKETALAGRGKQMNGCCLCLLA
jgi:hypothetical protein